MSFVFGAGCFFSFFLYFLMLLLIYSYPNGFSLYVGIYRHLSNARCSIILIVGCIWFFEYYVYSKGGVLSPTVNSVGPTFDRYRPEVCGVG